MSSFYVFVSWPPLLLCRAEDTEPTFVDPDRTANEGSQGRLVHCLELGTFDQRHLGTAAVLDHQRGRTRSAATGDDRPRDSSDLEAGLDQQM